MTIKLNKNEILEETNRYNRGNNNSTRAILKNNVNDRAKLQGKPVVSDPVGSIAYNADMKADKKLKDKGFK